MTLYQAGVQCEIVEVDLKDKPATMLTLSAKGSVPVLQLESGEIIDESLAIMNWALAVNDPDGWLSVSWQLAGELIAENDGVFKWALDRYKYPQRYPDEDCSGAREKGVVFLKKLNALLLDGEYLLGACISYADIAIFPFVRQFVNVDPVWFACVSLRRVQRWLEILVNSLLFTTIMKKNATLLIDA